MAACCSPPGLRHRSAAHMHWEPATAKMATRIAAGSRSRAKLGETAGRAKPARQVKLAKPVRRAGSRLGVEGVLVGETGIVGDAGAVGETGRSIPNCCPAAEPPTSAARPTPSSHLRAWRPPCGDCERALSLCAAGNSVRNAKTLEENTELLKLIAGCYGSKSLTRIVAFGAASGETLSSTPRTS